MCRERYSFLFSNKMNCKLSLTSLLDIVWDLSGSKFWRIVTAYENKQEESLLSHRYCVFPSGEAWRNGAKLPWAADHVWEFGNSHPRCGGCHSSCYLLLAQFRCFWALFTSSYVSHCRSTRMFDDSFYLELDDSANYDILIIWGLIFRLTGAL